MSTALASRWRAGVWVWPMVFFAGVVSLRALLSLRGYLYMDDFAFRYWAATSPFDTEYLLRSYGGHVNPVGLALQWVLQAAFPGSYLALAICSLAFFAGSVAVFALILWHLTEQVAAVCCGVVLAGVSLFTFEVTVWWAAALYAGPYQFFLLLTLYACLRRLGGASRIWSGIALVSAGLTALSFSRGAAGLLLVFLIAASVPAQEGQPRGLKATWRSLPALWSAMLGVGVIAGLVVISHAGTLTRTGFTAFGALKYMWELLVFNALPAIWGGPWRWFELPNQEWDPILANPAPRPWMAALAVLATLAAALWIWTRRPGLRLLLGALAGYLVLILGLAAYARAGSFVASVAYRYTFDLVWPVTLLLVLATFGAGRQRTHPVAAGLVLPVVLGVSALASTLVPAAAWASNPTKLYMANATAGFVQIPGGQAVLNQGVPFDLIHPALMAPYANTRAVLTPQPGAPAFADVVEGEMWGFATDGSVQLQDVKGPTSPSGPDPDCGYRVTDVPRTIPLDGNLIAWDFYARVAYFTGIDTTLNLAVGGSIHTVSLQADGLRAVYFPVSGPGSDVLVSVGTPGATICVTEVRVGNRISADSGEQVPLPVTKLPDE